VFSKYEMNMELLQNDMEKEAQVGLSRRKVQNIRTEPYFSAPLIK
jgi:hypothetical protein